MRDEPIQLVTESTSKDGDGFPVTTEKTFGCLAEMRTAKRTEFYQAATAGYTVRYVCLVDDVDYACCMAENGRPLKVRYRGTDLKIFREYTDRPSHAVELTLTEGD